MKRLALAACSPLAAMVALTHLGSVCRWLDYREMRRKHPQMTEPEAAWAAVLASIIQDGHL